MPFLQTIGGGTAQGYRAPTIIQGAAASGGSEATYGDWKSHTFNSNGTLTVTTGGNMEFLIIAGGGGGGCDNAGGGGAGGLLYYGTETPKTPNGGAQVITAGSYNVVVGNGGPGHSGPSDGNTLGGNNRGMNGQNSSVFGYTATGGGSGASSDGGGGDAGSGGSGGGRAGNTENPTGGSGQGWPSNNVSGQGNPGGRGDSSGNGGGGGGGGAGATGQEGQGASGGDGGAGLQYSIRNGSNEWFAAGGNGGNENGQYGNDSRKNGIGGRTNDTSGGTPGFMHGVANTGSGGGGHTHNATPPAGHGASGIVIVRYQPNVNTATLGTQSNPASHPDALASANKASGTYWFTIGGAVREMEYVKAGVGGLNWVRCRAISSGNTGTNGFWESLGYTTQSNVGVTNQGWQTHDSKRYFLSYPNSNDYEVWNNFTISDMSIRYVRGQIYWAPVGGNTVLNGGHPDNNQYNDFRNNDPDYNNLDDGGVGGNKSWHRFGVAGQFQLTYDELGWTGERSVVTSIYYGQKNGYFAGNVSRNNQGNNSQSYIDMGESSSGRVFRWSSGSESGAPPNERFAWSPYDIWLS